MAQVILNLVSNAVKFTSKGQVQILCYVDTSVASYSQVKLKFEVCIYIYIYTRTRRRFYINRLFR